MKNNIIIDVTLFASLFLLLQFAPTSAFSQKTLKYGVRLDYFQSKLVQIDEENYSGYMLSDLNYTQENSNGLSPTIFIEMELSSRWYLNGGICFINHKSKFHFDYQNIFTLDINSKLLSELYYLTIPIGAKSNQ